jgi:hypothetical protein
MTIRTMTSLTPPLAAPLAVAVTMPEGGRRRHCPPACGGGAVVVLLDGARRQRPPLELPCLHARTPRCPCCRREPPCSSPSCIVEGGRASWSCYYLPKPELLHLVERMRMEQERSKKRPWERDSVDQSCCIPALNDVCGLWAVGSVVTRSDNLLLLR